MDEDRAWKIVNRVMWSAYVLLMTYKFRDPMLLWFLLFNFIHES